MAQVIGLSPTQVKIWFQNHRYKAKKSEKERREGDATATTSSRQPLSLMHLGHVKTERTQLGGDGADHAGYCPSTMTISARLQSHRLTGSGRTKDEDGEACDNVADNIGDTAMRKTDIDAETNYFGSNGTAAVKLDIATSFVIPHAASSRTESDSAVELTSQNWIQLSGHHLARLQYQPQQQRQNGGGDGILLTELKPVHVGDLGAAAVTASSTASSAVVADASGGGYPATPLDGSFGHPPSLYCVRACESYPGAPAALEATSFSSAYPTHAGRTW